MRNYEIKRILLMWLQTHLRDREHVFSESGKSLDLSVNIGVLQDNVLGPLLFILHVNDIEKTVGHNKLHLICT